MRIRGLRDNPLLATAFVALLVAGFAGHVLPLSAAFLLIATGCLLANTQLVREANVRERNAAIVLVLVLTAMLPISTLRNETAVIYYFSSLVSLGAAFMLTRNVDVYLRASRYILVGSQAAVLTFLMVNGIANFPLEHMIPNSSSNGITSYLVLFQANYCVVRFVSGRGTALPTSLVTLFVCIIGYGRGSIVAATGLLLLGVGAKVLSGGAPRVIARFAVMFVAIMLVALQYGGAISDFVLGKTKIGAGFTDPSRLAIMAGYRGNIDASSLLLGATYAGTPIETDYNGNPHNSLIRAHHIFGLAYLAFMLVVPFYLASRDLSFGARAYTAGIWLFVVFRSFTEPIIFPTLFDFFYFAGCFIVSRDRESPA
jgi:hypothetical protein